MKTEQLEEIGFKLLDEYVHGYNDEFVTQVYGKGILSIDLDFDKNNKVLKVYDSICISGTYLFIKITIEELKQLDKILNK